MLKLNIKNCSIAGILGFQEAPFKKGAVSQSSGGAAAAQGLGTSAGVWKRESNVFLQSFGVVFSSHSGNRHVQSSIKRVKLHFRLLQVAAWWSHSL